jgi:hypothetical protein
MPRGFCRPFDERLSQELGALEAPVDPDFVAAPFRHRRNASILLEFLSGSVAVALFAKGDEEAGGKDGPSSWQGIK